MQPDESLTIEPVTTVAAIIPSWMQEALAVLLQASPDLELIACTTSVQALLPLVGDRVPDLILLDANHHDSLALNQLSRIKESWPRARCIALVEYSRQRDLLRAAGADEALAKGASPQQLLDVIHGCRHVSLNHNREHAE